MDRREPMSGINRNNLSTPSRPLSREQFFSVRERIVKDTPKLYQGRSIATDEKKERTDERVFTPTSVSTYSAISPRNPYSRLLKDRRCNRMIWGSSRILCLRSWPSDP